MQILRLLLDIVWLGLRTIDIRRLDAGQLSLSELAESLGLCLIVLQKLDDTLENYVQFVPTGTLS